MFSDEKREGMDVLSLAGKNSNEVLPFSEVKFKLVPVSEAGSDSNVQINIFFCDCSC